MNSLSIILSLAFLPNFVYTLVPFALNPNCSEIWQCSNDTEPALYYASHIINNDKIHILYSTVDELTISILQTAKDYTPQINYEALFARNYSAAISFGDTAPTNSFSFIIRRLIEFNDTNDDGVIGSGDTILNSYYLANMTTTKAKHRDAESNQPSFELPLNELNGSLIVDIMYPGEEMREKEFPKHKTTPTSYFINIALNANVSSSSRIRFAFELYSVFIGDGGAKMFSSKFIDDQYTPGIFNVYQVNTLDAQYGIASMLWKPVVYLSEERSIEQNTLMKVYDMKNKVVRDPTIDNGIFLSVRSNPMISGFNISLGQANDGFFTKANYSFIQLTAGLGSIKPDSTQAFVTVALIISLALPALVAVVALLIIIKRRITRNRSSSYDAIDS